MFYPLPVSHKEIYILKLKSFEKRKKVLLPALSRITSSKLKMMCAPKMNNLDRYYRSQNLTLVRLLPSSCFSRIYLHSQAKIVWNQEEGVTTTKSEQDYIAEREVSMFIKVKEFYQYYWSQHLTLAFILPLSRFHQVHLHAQAKIVKAQGRYFLPARGRITSLKQKLLCALILENFDQYYRWKI